MHSLGLLPPCKPPCLFPLTHVAHSCPSSRPRCGCSLFASRHRFSHSQRWLIPLHGRARSGAAPFSQAGIAVPSIPGCCLALGCGCSLLAHPASLLPDPEMANSGPWLGCSLLASRHPSSPFPTVVSASP